MTISELTSKLIELRSLIEEKSELMQSVRIFAAYYEHGDTALSEMLPVIDTNNVQTEIATLRNLVQEVPTRIRSISFNKIYKQSEQLKDVLNRYRDVDESKVDVIHTALNEYEEQFETVTKTYATSENGKLILIAHKLFTAITRLYELTDFLSANVNQQLDEGEEEQRLTLLLPSANEYSDITNKLNALNEIYTELCSLLRVSTSEYPLRIVKIETGSLWVELIGNAIIMGLIAWLIRAAIGYIHRNYTNEGKILLIPRQMEAANSILQFKLKLRQAAKEAGIETTLNLEELQKVEFKSARHLNTIVANQSTITVNSETLSIGDAYEQKFLEESQTLLLEDGSQSSNVGKDREITKKTTQAKRRTKKPTDAIGS